MHKHKISFQNAIIGIWTAVTTQVNIRIHVLIGSLVLFAAVYLELSLDHILDLLLVIALVITTELVNTAIEATCDAVTLDHHPQIKIAKDVAAGAVLFVSVFAILVGLIIFIPKLLSL